MRHAFTLALSLLAAAALAEPPEIDPAGAGGAELAARARQAVGGMLTRLPDYTCQETLQRTWREAGGKKFGTLDRVRLEVAFVNGTEMYAWPGSTKFGELKLDQVISDRGAFGTGDFGEHLRGAYLAGLPLRLAGKDALEGRNAWKFTQSVPDGLSHFEVISPRARATVGYSVTAWHDAATLALLRFELRAAGFPRKIPFQSVFTATDYATVKVNDLPVRLPVMTEVSVVARDGRENRTVSSFSNCREYTGSSKLTFDAPTPEREPRQDEVTPPRGSEASLPAGVQIQVRLDDAVELKKVARGDTAAMTVARDAFRDGRKVLSAGARVIGRWTLVECQDSPISYCFAILEPESYRDGAASGPFRAALVSPSVERELASGGRGADAVRNITIPNGILHAGMYAPVLYTGIITKLSRGYRLTWRTLEVSGGSTP